MFLRKCVCVSLFVKSGCATVKHKIRQLMRRHCPHKKTNVEGESNFLACGVAQTKVDMKGGRSVDEIKQIRLV